MSTVEERVQVVQIGNAVVTLRHPTLSKEERVHREEEIKIAMLNFTENAFQKGEKENGNELSARVV